MDRGSNQQPGNLQESIKKYSHRFRTDHCEYFLLPSCAVPGCRLLPRLLEKLLQQQQQMLYQL